MTTQLLLGLPKRFGKIELYHRRFDVYIDRSSSTSLEVEGRRERKPRKHVGYVHITFSVTSKLPFDMYQGHKKGHNTKDRP